MSVRVRPARPDDNNFIEVLGLATALDTVSPVRAVSRAAAESAFRRLLAFCKDRPGTVSLVAERAGVLAGFLIMLTDMPDEVTQERQAFVAYVAVREADQGHGVGRALLHAAMAEGERRNLPFISLMVSADNLRAKALYESEHFMNERVLMSRALTASRSAR
jgi:ribosomal protein S18 acetylase RimI-like enzyme